MLSLPLPIQRNNKGGTGNGHRNTRDGGYYRLMDIPIGLALIGTLLMFYFLPAIVASERRHKDSFAIFKLTERKRTRLASAHMRTYSVSATAPFDCRYASSHAVAGRTSRPGST